jgi:hypothetical protein
MYKSSPAPAASVAAARRLRPMLKDCTAPVQHHQHALARWRAKANTAGQFIGSEVIAH